MTNPTNINGNFKNQHILSIDQFTTKDIDIILKCTKQMKDIAAMAIPTKLLEGNTVALIFYEPSSRTFASFSAAIKKLGGQTIEILDPTHFSSAAKGETLEDTIRVFESYADAIIIRHPQKGKAREAAQTSIHTPIINAGDGIGEHPTQALLDLATIHEKHGKLENLTGVIAGDLLNGRTVHSLIKALSLYKNNTLYLLAPSELRLSQEYLMSLRGGTTKQSREFAKNPSNINLIQIQNENQIPQNAHFWYWTRVQKERFTDTTQYEKLKTKFTLTKELVKNYAAPHTILMHPLPRVGEIETTVDEDERAVYLTSQIKNGLYVRMALLALVLGKM